MPVIPTRRLDQLTITRFLAAMVVVQQHYGPVAGLFAQPSWALFATAGQTAVGWFYTLSGFILATVHADLQPNAAFRFWWARFARIYPSFIVALIAYGWVLSATPWRFPVAWLLNLSALQAWSPDHVYDLNVVGWSISVEAAMYALFPVIIRLTQRWQAKRIWAAALGLWLVTQTAQRALAAGVVPHDWQYFINLLVYLPPWHLNAFVLGVAAAVTVRRRLQPIPVLTGAALLVGGVLAVFVTRRWLEPMLPGRAGFEHDDWVGLLAPAFAAIMAGATSIDLPPLRLRVLRLLGEASFAMYIFQQSVATVCERHGITDPAMFGTLIASCIAIHLGFEQPMRKWLRQIGPNPTTTPLLHEVTLQPTVSTPR